MGKLKGKSDSRNRKALRIVRQPTLMVNEDTSETGTIADLLEEVKKLLTILCKSKKDHGKK